MAIGHDLEGPALEPPQGTESNFHSPDSMRTEVIICETLSISIATLSVIMRLYTRKWLIGKIGWEDYTLLLGWCMFIPVCGLSIMTTVHGVGMHLWDVRLKDFFTSLYWINIMSICYGPTVFVIKLSILLQYLSIFVPVRKGNMFIFVGTWMIIGANFIYYTANTFIIAFLCTPRELIWNKNITEGKCIDLGIVLFVLGIYNAFSNLAILLLPIGPIWRLNLGWKQRLGVFAVFATGFLAVVASVARVIYTLRLKDHEDLTYNMVFLGFWTIAELGIGILCAALLVFPRFYQTMTYNVKHMMGVTPKTSVSEPSMKTGTSQEPWITGHQSDFERGGDYYWLDDRDPVPANKRRNHSSTRVRASRTDPFQGLSMAGAEGLGILKTVQIDVVRE